MTLVRMNPYRALTAVERELGNMLGGLSWYGQGNAEKRDWVPAAEIKETKEAFKLELELPGVEKEDVKINLEENVLNIRGEKKSEKNTATEEYTACEREYGSFARSFTLPNTVDAGKIEANFKNGILYINIPKAESVKPKEIQIS